MFPFSWQHILLHVLICRFLTAHSLRSLKAQRTLSFNFFFLSAERAERKKQHPFGKFSLLIFIGVRTYDSLAYLWLIGWQLLTRRRQIVFHLPPSQRQMKIIYFSVISASLAKRAVNVFKSFHDSQIHRECNLFCAPLSNIDIQV